MLKIEIKLHEQDACRREKEKDRLVETRVTLTCPSRLLLFFLRKTRMCRQSGGLFHFRQHRQVHVNANFTSRMNHSCNVQY